MPKAAIFDLDGTLLDSVDLHALAWHEAMAKFGHDVSFSNRPLGVKHFQTIHVCGVGVAHGLVLLFGIGTKALLSWELQSPSTAEACPLPPPFS